MAEDVRQATGAAFEVVGELLVVKAQGREHGGVEIVDVHLALHRAEAEFIRCADGLAAADSPPPPSTY